MNYFMRKFVNFSCLFKKKESAFLYLKLVFVSKAADITVSNVKISHFMYDLTA